MASRRSRRKRSSLTSRLSPGPRKQRKVAPSPARLSRHKARAAWFRARVAWPLRDVAASRLHRLRRQARRRLNAAKLAGDWQLAGPSNIGGRCTALLCDPRAPDRLLIGAAGGGVWFSPDAGATWAPQWLAGAPQEIGALARDPADPDTIYCGTGEANLSADSYPGDGVYRSRNGGKTWRRWASSAGTGVPTRIGAIAVDPFDGRHVLVGGVGFGRVSTDGDFGGLHATHDGGRTWARATFVSEQNYWCHAIAFHPTVRGVIFVTVTEPGSRSGVYRSTDGGRAWTRLTGGLPSGDAMGRTALALAPSRPDTMYAQVADARSSTADRVLGVYRTRNGGATWTNVAANHFAAEEQMSYGNTIVVHPADPEHVLCGGVDLHRTINGGNTWRQVTKWDSVRGATDYAHADHHLLVMPAAAPGRVYSANDGGLDVSDDGGQVWRNRSDGLAVTMFYDVDIAQSDARVLGGGAQDNGTVVTKTGEVHEFFELLGGDGGWMVVDPDDASHVFASYQLGSIFRFRGTRWRDVSPPFKPAESGGIWMVYVTLQPGDARVVYTGNQRLYRSRNDGDSWTALTPVLDGSPISAIEVAPADVRYIYVGTENGGLFRSTDGGVTWSANLAGATLPGVMITRIETHPADARRAFVVVGNSGHSHVFATTDAGLTWRDIDGGKLPDAPIQAAVVRPDADDELWVCGDAGVFVTTNGGKTWQNATRNLPGVMVVDLVYHRATKSLVAATYGRSLWRVSLA
jgi:photosystem II stability/assembly factor-like uncharacterized protein